jgi:hypothetical protein
METLLYVLLYLHLGGHDIPWQGRIKASEREQAANPEMRQGIERRRRKRTAKRKRMMLEQLSSKSFEGSWEPFKSIELIADQLAAYLKHVRSVRRGQKPDYNFLLKQVRKAMLESKYSFDYQFDWCDMVPVSIRHTNL